MISFEKKVLALTGHLDGAHRIDRAQIDRNNNLAFSINGATWCRFDGENMQKLYALDDAKIPLAKWASQQPPRRIIVLAYRPGKRLVVRDLERDLIIKGYAKGKSAKPAQHHQIASQALSNAGDVTTPSLVRHDEELSTIELSYCRNQAMHITKAHYADIEHVGQAVAKLQHATTGNISTLLNRFSPNDELKVLSTWRTKAQAVGIGVPAAWTCALESLSHSTPDFPRSVLTHRDLHDGQCLGSSSPSSLCLLDFDSLCLAHPMLDLGNFAAHIDLRYAQWIKTDDDSMRLRLDCLLGGYAEEAEIDLNALRWFRIATLLRLALVYAIRPRWQHLKDRLTTEAETLIRENILLES